MRHRVIIRQRQNADGSLCIVCAGRPRFQPDLTPKADTRTWGVLGDYLTDCRENFPASWFARAKPSPVGRD